MLNKAEYLNLFLEVCQESNLIETVDHIDGLIDIEGYDYKPSLSETEQIRDALTWAFLNDRLDDFYNEYWEEVFIHTELAHLLLTGTISHSNSMLDLTYTLYRISSENEFYYKVEKSGYLSDGLWDESGFFETTKDINKEAEVIESFKDKCESIATNFDEFDDDVMDANGISVDFY
jgi:hypothetical protein